MELRRGTFHVLLDNTDVGSIDTHNTIEVPIEPGHHTPSEDRNVEVKAGRYISGDTPLTRPTAKTSTPPATAPAFGPSTSPPSSSPTKHSRSSTSNTRREFATPSARYDGNQRVLVRRSRLVEIDRHDMSAWNALTVEEQERAIGRAKLSNVEVGADVKPANSCLTLNTIVEPGETHRQILRENMPFGSLSVGGFDICFIGYAATSSVTERCCSTCSWETHGSYEGILGFSDAVTGSWFFVPTAGFLDDPLPWRGHPDSQRGADLDQAAPSGRPVASDGSLGIGGLRETRSASNLA